MSVGAAHSLDEALRTLGGKARRGGAVGANPNSKEAVEYRRLIRLYNSARQMREQSEQGGFGGAFDVPGDSAEGREEGLGAVFAAGRNSGKRSSGGKRSKGYARWRPQSKTVTLVAQIKDVLSQYEAELPLTARQIFYRLVGAYGYHKDERAYERLTNVLVRARRARLISFEDIRDDGASVLASEHHAGEEAFYGHVRKLGRSYERDKLVNQKLDIRLYCEAEGMMPQLSRVSSRYSVPVYSCSGYDSLTAKYDLVRDVRGAFTYEGRRTVVLHLGDYDPSGENIFDSITEDVHTFIGEDIWHKEPAEVVLFERLALVPNQVREHELSTAPPKATDSRTKRWKGEAVCQLEALPPDVLAGVVAGGIERYLDLDILKADREAEAEERRRISLALPAGGTA